LQHVAKYQDLVYDVGMHKGEDSDYYLKKGFRVIGFEADPILAEHCRSRFSDEVENGRLIVVNAAIVELPDGLTKGKTVQFFRNKESSVWGTVVDSRARRNELLGTRNEIIDVPAVDFSEYLEKYGMPYYMKIDIEGNDKVCLRSMLKFEQRPDYVSIESEKVSFIRPEEELNLFTSLGFTRFKAIQQASIAK
jgi:FkbM family methyltransferase